MQPIILVIEDEESLNKGISTKLSKERYHVFSANSLGSAKEIMQEVSPQLIICDIGLPDGNGLDFCKKLRKKSDVLFLFLTALDTELDIIKGYDVGADDYVTKPFSLAILLSKVNAMINRHEPKENSKIICDDITLFLEEGRLVKNNAVIHLSPNEWTLLDLLMKNATRIISKDTILDALWEIDSDFIDENAVAVNIRRLREKIESDPSNPQYIKNVRGLGYIWEVRCEYR